MRTESIYIYDQCGVLSVCTAKHAKVARTLLAKKPPQYKKAHVSLSAAIDLLADADMFLERSVCNLHMGKVWKRFCLLMCQYAMVVRAKF